MGRYNFLSRSQGLLTDLRFLSVLPLPVLISSSFPYPDQNVRSFMSVTLGDWLMDE
jgi:hypothetical protein